MILHNILVELIQINCYCEALLHMPVIVGYWLWKKKKTDIINEFSCSHFVFLLSFCGSPDSAYVRAFQITSVSVSNIISQSMNTDINIIKKDKKESSEFYQ